MIEFINVQRTYNDTVAVENVSLRIEEGELCVLLGPSGCGKTTLLRMVNRLVEPTSGRIMVNGQNVLEVNPVKLRRGIGYVIQGVGLFPHRTVAENIATTPVLLRTPASVIAGRVDELLALVKLDPARYRNRYPRELSGGEAQRVGVARALAADPPLVLMDEPFGAIDPINRAAIRDEFLELQQRLRKTIIFVSHDIQEALHLADRIVLMRAGRIEQHGTPAELLAKPATEFVERFFGSGRRMLLLDVMHAADAIDPEISPSISIGRSIDAGAALRDVLLLLLAGNEQGIGITGSDGTIQGIVTLRSIQRCVASSLEERIWN